MPHEWVDGVCFRCGTQCSHNYYNSLDCSICGHKGTIEISLSDSVLRVEQTNFNNFGYTYCVLVENNESSESFELTTFSGSAGYYWDGVSIDLNELNLVNFNGQTCSISVFAQQSGVGVVYSNKLEYTVPNAEHTHSYEWQTKIDATCISAGAEQGFCSCGASADREIPALGHDYVNGVCSRCGTQCQHVHENGHICPICGCEVEKKLTWRVVKPATCTENGVEYGDCICGYNSEMREIPATGHTFDAGICTSCNALDEEFYNNFVGYWFTETTGFKKESFGKYYIQVYKDGDNYIFTRSGYKVENGEIVLYQNSTDYSDPETWTFTSTNRIIEFTLTRQDITFNGTYDGQTLVVGDMTFTKTDKSIRYDGSTSYVTPL